jgi:hypothetical protein
MTVLWYDKTLSDRRSPLVSSTFPPANITSISMMYEHKQPLHIKYLYSWFLISALLRYASLAFTELLDNMNSLVQRLHWAIGRARAWVLWVCRSPQHHGTRRFTAHSRTTPVLNILADIFKIYFSKYIFLKLVNIWAVIIHTGLWLHCKLDDRGSIPSTTELFSSSHYVGSGAHPASYPAVLSPEVKRSGRVANHISI